MTAPAEGGAPAGAGPTDADWAAAVAAVRALPAAARVLLICHVNPDGDALGSMLGFGLGLRRFGVRNLQATFPGPPGVPEPFRWLPGLELLVPQDEAYLDPDLVICFDAASESRLGDLVDRLDKAGAALVLDHHASNTRFGGIHLVDPHAAATSVVAEGLLDRLGVPLDAEIAACLYVALSTDTGSFRFEATTPAVHEMAARLLATGIRPGDISRLIFDTRPFGAVRLFGEVLVRARLERAAAAGRGLVWTYATREDLARHDQPAYVLEALIDSVRCTAEADVSCVVKQVADAEWAVSLRSKGAVDVSAVAVALGGGGHRFAAGFTGRGSVDEVVDRIRAELGGALLTG
ncbi:MULTISPECIES: bifunctional oligoribonuclease/PAP phosphatase NrnA [Micromonospora]|uniref:Bifunctional oligoribonuclease/PAP phosphatase NrnA n=1 Tax=Micromonospora solifontis TaxID=2487138 RepID=A0ABX9WQP0_9ACTN|nr:MULTISPECIES: bifunctional oligoribonuclease/PAP phosphatase NrnA [Micromonospora]NES12760.1 bifunctional oligoribonuclease/PAP phosphatase NrnA [Micromonospora sp. PPF5-17B]NES34947.1 bifunctional oligoribonuclease/PAP phosphatase NrnA [Micromonospora solifontis]NES54685.1 bifunctional oligoribonuclease/PAP phosphatase NrnA [Micromonospora sp. PPF5-6]RNM01509.1 bifunctional oligoribonuclease/PAP phosphatase NrnA [Micromonospora solifontis]